MRQLIEFLKESLNQSIIDGIISMSEGTADYLNNEGVIDYDEAVLREYANRTKNIDYKDFIVAIKDSYSNYVKYRDALKALGEYPQKNKEQIEDAIIIGISNYIS